jgi:hypothetical protein
MGFRSFIERNVRAVWERHEQPSKGYVWASIPVPPDITLAEIPFLPECSRIEIERVGEDGPVRLIYRKETS